MTIGYIFIFMYTGFSSRVVVFMIFILFYYYHHYHHFIVVKIHLIHSMAANPMKIRTAIKQMPSNPEMVMRY